MKSTAIILAAGEGRRFGGSIPKQFVEMHDYPLLWYSLNAFKNFDPEIHLILVLNENHFETWKQICRKKEINISHVVVTGGKSRSESVKNALHTVTDDGIIFIHDGARPCFSTEFLERIKRGVIEKGSAIPVIPEKNAVRIKHGNGYLSFDREKVLIVQTPQGFLIGEIKNAYKEHYNKSAKDDAEMAELAGIKIHQVEGDYENIKVTFPIDLEIAEVILRKQIK